MQRSALVLQWVSSLHEMLCRNLYILFLVTSRTSHHVSVNRLDALSFPVRQEVADALGVPVLGTRDPKRAAQLIGNCMALQCAALVQLVALSCFSMKRVGTDIP